MPRSTTWGITSAGKLVFLGLEPGSTENHDAWPRFFRGLKARACAAGHHRRRGGPPRGGTCWPVPAHGQAEAKAELRAIFDSIDAQPGPNAGAEASRRAEAFAAKWRKLSPAAVDCLEYDFEHLVTFLLIEGGWSRVA